jgi:hypothetical protein
MNYIGPFQSVANKLPKGTKPQRATMFNEFKVHFYNLLYGN